MDTENLRLGRMADALEAWREACDAYESAAHVAHADTERAEASRTVGDAMMALESVRTRVLAAMIERDAMRAYKRAQRGR